MKPSILIRSGAIAASVAALLMAAPAHAALDADAVSCRAAIAKTYQKLAKTASKVIGGCHKSRNKGDASLLAVDCNDLVAADAAKGKYAKAAGKAEDGIIKSCPPSLDSTLTTAGEGDGIDYYISCPTTCPGVPQPLATMADVAKCMPCAAGAQASTAAAASLGMPDPTMLSKDDQKCAAAIAKGYPKYMQAALKDETSCQGAADKVGNNDTSACLDADAKGKVAKTLTKADDGLTKSCAAANLVNVAACATDTIGNLQGCSTTAWGDADNNGYEEIYELPATGCPTVVRTTIRGRCGLNGDAQGSCLAGRGLQSATVLNVGWKGLAHGVDITDSYTLAGAVDCPGSEKGSCGVCTVTGVSADNPQYEAFTRCKDRTWVECTKPFNVVPGDPMSPTGPDQVCLDAGGNGECRYFLGPPLSISVGGTFTCTHNVVDQEIEGDFNPDTGESNLQLRLRSVVHLGQSQTRPCSYCSNDLVAQDGVTDGTCVGTGPREGMPCDVQGFDLNFAQTDVNNPTDGNSLDCPRPLGANISGEGLTVNLDLTTGISSKAAEDPCESPNQAYDCFCGVCDDDDSQSCNNDNDCVLLFGGGAVCNNGSGPPRQPNNCLNLTCSDTGKTDGTGNCTTSAPPDVDTYCSGATFADGKGIISCTDDAGCEAFETGGTCPNDDCGTCSIGDFRSCFLDPITLSGSPDPTNPVLAGTFCLPPSSNGSVNLGTGTPGPGSVKTDAILDLRY